MSTTSTPLFTTASSTANLTTHVDTNIIRQQSSVMAIFSVIIAVFGIVFNSLSLSYFISKIRFGAHRRNNDASTTKLFAALVVFDLSVSVALSLFFIVSWRIDHYYQYQLSELLSVIDIVCTTSVQMTGFLTCLLAVVRAIHLIFPFYVINFTAVNISIAVHSLILVIWNIHIYHVYRNYVRPNDDEYLIGRIVDFFYVLVMFLTVVLSNLFSLLKLYCSQSSHEETRENKRKATTTVAIISAIYCVCNIGFVINFGKLAIFNKNLDVFIVNISYFILLPLNSASNPLVYLIRKKDMRQYVKKLSGRLMRWRERESNADPP